MYKNLVLQGVPDETDSLKNKRFFLMIAAIISLPSNIIFAIMALIFVCEDHVVRIQRLQQPNFFCCCGKNAFKVVMWILTAPAVLFQLSLAILSFSAANICQLPDCTPEQASSFRGSGGYFVFLVIGELSLATCFTVYINSYVRTYNIQPAIGVYSRQ